MSIVYKVPVPIILMLLALTPGAFATQDTQDDKASVYGFQEGIDEAPFGGEVSPNINNYTRAAPYLGTAGRISMAGIEEAKRLGFKLGPVDKRASQFV